MSILLLLLFSLDNAALSSPKVKKELSLITNTFGGQTHAWQWDRYRWWGPPPCYLECVVWTGLLSSGSLHPVLRWGALLDNHHQSHLKEENKEQQYNNIKYFTQRKIHRFVPCIWTMYKLLIHFLFHIHYFHILSRKFYKIYHFPPHLTQPACGQPLP